MTGVAVPDPVAGMVTLSATFDVVYHATIDSHYPDIGTQSAWATMGHERATLTLGATHGCSRCVLFQESMNHNSTRQIGDSARRSRK